MTWILPNQLHTLASALDTAALISDLNEQSQICAQSLLVRSKLSPARIWSRKWKRDSWTRHLSGRILKPSLGKSFTTAWASSLEVIPASHSALPASDSEKTIRGISGHSSQTEFPECDPASVSLKMLKDTSRWDSPQSSATWKSWVTRSRLDYSRRLKLARLISESGCSSWPTATTRDWKGPYRPESLIRSDGKSRAMDTLDQAVITAQNWPTPATADGGKIGNRPNFGQICLSNHPAIVGKINREKLTKDRAGSIKQWPTPTALETLDQGTNWESLAKADKGGRILRRIATLELASGLGAQANPSTNGSHLESWATPRNMTGGTCQNGIQHSDLNSQAGGKLNPRWVETLMGLPVGWTMPSCARPVTIEPMNCGSLGTESSQQPLNERSES